MRVCVRLIAAVRASFFLRCISFNFCRSASSSAFNHLTVKTGSRGVGQSASAKLAYVMREGNHAHDAPEREHVEHGNMPAWAQDDPRAYWSAADENERANGALFKEIEFALPKELHAGERCEVAHRFAEQLTDAGPAGKLPYTLAIHRGDGGESPRPPAAVGAGERRHRAPRRTVVQAREHEGPRDGRGQEMAGLDVGPMGAPGPRDLGGDGQ